jgi:hypothetical protein
MTIGAKFPILNDFAFDVVVGPSLAWLFNRLPIEQINTWKGIRVLVSESIPEDTIIVRDRNNQITIYKLATNDPTLPH